MLRRLHEETALFRAAVNYTAARVGFLPRLVEDAEPDRGHADRASAWNARLNELERQ